VLIYICPKKHEEHKKEDKKEDKKKKYLKP